MVIIFWFSSQPDLPSNSIDYIDFIIKKSAHFSEYLILTVLWYRALGRKNPSPSIFLSLIYAFSDEIHQLFVPGRGGSLRDVFIDFLGIAVSVLIISQLQVWKSFLSQPRSKKRKA
jgi:VanZ family protein